MSHVIAHITWFNQRSQGYRSQADFARGQNRVRTWVGITNALILCEFQQSSLLRSMDGAKYNLRNPAVKRIMQVSSRNSLAICHA